MVEKHMTIPGFVKAVIPFFKSYYKAVFLILVCMGIDIAYSNGVPILFQQLIDKALTPHDTTVLVVILICLAAGVVVEISSSLIQDMAYAKTGTAVMNEMRFRIFSHLQELSMDFYSKTQIGDIMSRFSSDLAAVENALIWYLPSVMTSSVGLIVSSVILFSLEWRLALISLVGIIISFGAAKILEKEASDLNYVLREEIGGVSVMLQENLSAQAVVKGFSLKNLTLGLFQSRLTNLRRVAVKTNWVNYLMGRIPNLGTLLVGICVLGIGAYFVFNNRMSVGSLVAFYTLFGRVSDCVSGLTYTTSALMEGAAGMERIHEILDEVPSIYDIGGKEPLHDLEHEIRLEHITFQYDDNSKSLDDVTISIAKGMSVAFVGSSGSGKSTILNLITRFYDPLTGVVLYDGKDIRGIGVESLHSQMGIVFQENILFDTSIRENIRMGKLTATDAEVEEAARNADIHDFILTLPDGYDTRVGERGGRLSGGQRQRIAIARAIIRKPSLIILDEATSALDPQTEVSVNKTIREIGKGRTVLSVTHRLSSATHCDRIFVMEKGKVVERGTHDELLSQSGVYAMLWKKQQGFSISDDGERAEVTAERLSMIPLFSMLDIPMLEDIAFNMGSGTSVKGDILIREGDSGGTFFAVARGTLEVLKKAPDGHQERVEILNDGDFFGEISLLKNIPTTATIRALSNVTYVTLKRDHFFRLVNRVPGMHQRIEELAQIRMEENATVALGAVGVMEKKFGEKA